MLEVVTAESPNWSERGGVEVDTIMIHSTGGRAEGSLIWLTSKKSGVSCHYLISRGGTIYKLVPTSKAAWHAGKCRVKNANKRSIGIELEQDPSEGWTGRQREILMRLIRILVRAIPTIKYLVGHKEWNKKKRDPYNVDMDELRTETGLGKI